MKMIMIIIVVLVMTVLMEKVITVVTLPTLLVMLQVLPPNIASKFQKKVETFVTIDNFWKEFNGAFFP
jgi:hypothetical protein